MTDGPEVIAPRGDVDDDTLGPLQEALVAW